MDALVQKCQYYYYTLLNQSVPLVTVKSNVSLLTEQLCSWCYVNFRNTIISLEYVYFWTKIYRSLYPSTKISITHIAISCNVGTQFREKHQFSIRSTLNTLISIWTNHLSFNLVTLGSVGVVNRRFFSTFSLSPPHLRQSAPCRRLTRNRTSF